MMHRSLRAACATVGAGVFALVAAAVSGAAWAQPVRKTPVVAVCLDQEGEDPAAPALLCGHLQGWLRASERWAPVPLDQALHAGGAFDPVRSVLEAREHLETAKGEYAANRKAGLKALEAAADEIVALEPWLTDRELLADALLALLNAQLETLPKKEAWRVDETSARLLNFAPQMREGWKQKVRPGPLHDRLSEVQTYLETAPTGALEIECSEVACEVFVDGAFRGVTPLKLDGVAPGEHLVRVRRAGFVPTTQSIAVIPEQIASTKIEPPRAQSFTAYTGILGRLPSEVGGTRAESGLKDLRSLLGTDQVIAIRVLPSDEAGKSTVEVYLYDLRSEQLLGAVDVAETLNLTTDWGKLVASLMDSLVAAEKRQLDAASNTPTEEEDDSLLNKWWFWTGIGALVVGGVTTAVVLSIDDDAPTTPAPTPPDPNAGTIRLNF